MLSEYYNRLENGAIASFTVYPDGAVRERIGDEAKVPVLHVVSGSFDPLHEAHRALYYRIGNQPKVFELSVFRYGKEHLEWQEVLKRIKQFSWYAPVTVTHQWRYEGKAVALGADLTVFHIGFDTAVRLLETETTEWFNLERGIRFIVYQRKQGDTVKAIHDLSHIPFNFLRGHLPEGLEDISSTQLRTGVYKK